MASYGLRLPYDKLPCQLTQSDKELSAQNPIYPTDH